MADWLKMLWRRVSRKTRPSSFGLGSSLCALGVGTWLRAERGRRTGAEAPSVGSNFGSGAGVEAFEAFRGSGAASGDVGTLAATDERRGREEAAVAVAAGGGAITDSGTGDRAGCDNDSMGER